MYIHEEELNQYSDEEIISMIQSEKLDAMDYMLNRYKPFVRKKVKDFYLIGCEHDDLIQEGMIGLYKAIRDFNLHKESSFSYFADLCISRQIYTAIRSSNRKKNMPLNTYISINSSNTYDSSDSEDKDEFLERMVGSSVPTPEELIIDRERKTMLELELVRQLSSFEKHVLILFLKDMNYIEIATKLSKEPKSIDNALQRIRTKLNKVLKQCS